MAGKAKTMEQAAIEAEIQETAIMEVMKVKAGEEDAAELVETQKTQEERERLIADAYKMIGRIEALHFISKVADTATLVTLQKVKENKIYKDIPNIGTWENYCQSIGISRRYIDEQLDSLSQFGEEFLAVSASFGVGYKELRQLKKAASEGIIEVKGNVINISGEDIPLTDKDELKDAIERVISEKDAKIKEKDREIKAKDEVQKLLSERREKAEKEADKFKIELEKMKTATVGGIAPEDRPIYNNIKACEDRLAIVHKNLLEVADGNMSDFNQQLLGGVIMMMFQIAEDMRITVNAKGGVYLDRLYLTDEEMAACDNMLTPSKLHKDLSED